MLDARSSMRSTLAHSSIALRSMCASIPADALDAISGHARPGAGLAEWWASTVNPTIEPFFVVSHALARADQFTLWAEWWSCSIT